MLFPDLMVASLTKSEVSRGASRTTRTEVSRGEWPFARTEVIFVTGIRATLQKPDRQSRRGFRPNPV
ncbi:MAG: hypothetical protein SWX82_35680 [Cyanobacteriota bacterium]|nr:hypothetical protein [Cyanobacteriota bacterium]